MLIGGLPIAWTMLGIVEILLMLLFYFKTARLLVLLKGNTATEEIYFFGISYFLVISELPFSRMKIENATLKESLESMDHLIRAVRRLRLSLLKVVLFSPSFHRGLREKPIIQPLIWSAYRRDEYITKTTLESSN